MNGTALVALLVIGTLAAGDAAAAAEVIRPLLIVRMYHTTPISGDDWTMAARQTTEILDAAGIDLQWINCTVDPPPHDAPSRCAAALQRNEVALRLVRGQATDYRGQLPLGESLVDAVQQSGALATIYLDRVEWLARAANVRVITLLARAIAHELGHLLLGTATHSPRGLMRPVWTREELMRGRAADWVIPADDGDRMRVAYHHRIQPPNDATVALGMVPQRTLAHGTW